MSVKIRLQRKGRRKRPFYHIVVADARAPRDGRFIEKLGTYNPMTSPATIDLDRDAAFDWLMKGAQPTDCLLYTSPSPRDRTRSRMPSSA